MLDLKKLPDVLFTIKDAQKIEANLIRAWETGSGNRLEAADPRRLLFKTIADAIARLDVRADNAAKMNLLAYSKADFLEHIGAQVNTARLEASAAKCMVKFSLSAQLGFAVVVPEGTRVTKQGSGVYFKTLQALEIAAGVSAGATACECEQPGAAGNGYLAGEIDVLVDPIAYVKTVENIEVTAGGADSEDDESLRKRIQLAPESFSVAGPDEAYAYHAKSVSADIADVSVGSEAPGTVQLWVILQGGQLANQAVLQAVKDRLNDRKIRPLTDYVTVSSPKVVYYDISLTWYLLTDDLIFKGDIEAHVKEAVEDFAAWTKTKIGRDVNPTALIARLNGVGVKRVELASPKFTIVHKNEIACARQVSVMYGGAEDE